MNQYAYAVNNPRNFIDPSGLDPWDEGGGIGFGGGGFGGFPTIPNWSGIWLPGPGQQPNPASMIIFDNWGSGLGNSGDSSDFSTSAASNQPSNLAEGTPKKYWQPFGSGFKAAMEALNRKSCANYFGGQGPETMNGATYFFEYPNPNNPTVAAWTAGQNVFINPDGAFMTYSRPLVSRDYLK